MGVSQINSCPYCTAHSLDPIGQHALTCKHGGDVVTRDNRLHNVFVESCRRACIGVQVEVGGKYGSEECRKRPADVLATNWMLGKPAAFDFTVISPLVSNILPEASVTAGSAAFVAEVKKNCAKRCQICRTWPADIIIVGWDRGKPAALDPDPHFTTLLCHFERIVVTQACAAALAAEVRKLHSNGLKCQELGWSCIPLAVETYGNWGKEAHDTFSQASILPGHSPVLS
eukprot:Em0566g4a